MKNERVTLAPLCQEEREGLILDNQLEFKYGASAELGEHDTLATVLAASAFTTRHAE